MLFKKLFQYNLLLGISKILSLLGMSLLVRNITSHDLGQATVLINVFGQSAILSNLGIEIFAVREVLKKDPGKQVGFYSSIWILRFLLSIIGIFFIILYYENSNPAAHNILFYIFVSSIVLYNNINSDWIFQIKSLYNIPVIIQIIFLTVLIFTYLFAFGLELNWQAYIYSLGTASLLSMFILLFFLFKVVKFKFKPVNICILYIFELLKSKILYICLGIFFINHFQSGIEYVLMSLIYTYDEIGYYKASLNYYNFVQGFTLSIPFLILPSLCKDTSFLKNDGIKLYLFLIILVVSSFMYLTSDTAISVMYGNLYKSSVYLSEYFSFLLLISSLSNIYTSILISRAMYSTILLQQLTGFVIYYIIIYLFKDSGIESFIIAKATFSALIIINSIKIIKN